MNNGGPVNRKPVLVGSAGKIVHWAVKYVGLPYEIGSRGPEKYDCWGLFKHVYEKEFGIKMPDLPGITMTSVKSQSRTIEAGIEDEWVNVLQPFDGAGVAMGQKQHIHHVGIYLDVDGGKILHANSGTGVVASSPAHLRILGFHQILYYRHKLWRL